LKLDSLLIHFFLPLKIVAFTPKGGCPLKLRTGCTSIRSLLAS